MFIFERARPTGIWHGPALCSWDSQPRDCGIERAPWMMKAPPRRSHTPIPAHLVGRAIPNAPASGFLMRRAMSSQAWGWAVAAST